MPSKTHFDDVTQLFNLLRSISTKTSSADFAATDDQLLRIEAHAPGVFRLRFGSLKHIQPERVRPREQQYAEMLLARLDPVGELEVVEQDTGWRIEQGECAVEIDKDCFALRVYAAEQLLWQSQSLQDDADNWKLSIALDAGESIYGLGETEGNLNRRGSLLVSDNPSHRVLPLAWSNRGWGLYINTFERVEHDVAHTEADYYNLTIHDGVLDLFIFVGRPLDILNQYTALTGRAGQPGLWPMGVWLEQIAGQDLAQAHAHIAELKALNIGIDVVHMAPPAPLGFSADRPLFEWDSSRIGEIRHTISAAEEAQFKIVVSTFPGVLVGTGMFDEWEDRGWLLINDDDGLAFVFPGNALTGGKDFALLDLTHKDAYKLWVERLSQSYEEELGGVICNVQYDLPDCITARSGESGAKLRTVYPLLARSAVFDAFAGHKTPQEGLVASRDFYPSAHRFAWQLGPDVSNDWQGLANTLQAALSAGNSGITAQSHQIGSVNHPIDPKVMTPELYLRWLAMGVFSANFHIQAIDGLMPQSFDAETQALIAHWLRWRYRLVPYVLGIIEESVRCGLPVQRSLALEFPDDPEVVNWPHQYMFGSTLLVAPFVAPGDEIEVYLPAGSDWWDISTGWRYEGGRSWKVKAGLDRLPVFGRDGYMLCLGLEALNTSEFNSARLLEEVWMFGMPEESPAVMRNKIRVMQMQGSSYIKGLEGLKILPSEGLEVKRRGAEVRISPAR